jgi:F0F1-type ATP synthase membrane subunit b/b'
VSTKNVEHAHDLIADLRQQLDQARAEVERMYNLAGEDSEGKTQRDYHELESQLAVRERELAEAREQMQRACDGGDVFFLEQWLAAHPEPPK